MQIDKVEVRREGAFVQVDFVAEGGEHVSSQMRMTGSFVSDDGWIDKARVMLVQAANFGLSANPASVSQDEDRVSDDDIRESHF